MRSWCCPVSVAHLGTDGLYHIELVVFECSDNVLPAVILVVLRIVGIAAEDEAPVPLPRLGLYINKMT